MKIHFSLPLLLLPLLSARAPAQPDVAPPLAAVAPAPLPKEPLIEPAARAAIEALVARYQAMNSYSDTLTMSGFAGNLEAKIRWQKPNRARVEAVAGGKIGFGLNDGTTLWALHPEHPGYYLKRAGEANRAFDAFMEADVGAPGFTLTLEDGARKGVAEMLRDGLTGLEMGIDEEFEGAPMQVVRASFAFNDGHDSLMTILIGQKDGLLHQLRQSYTGMGNIIETHRDMQVNPVLPPETWRWTPPQGLKPVENFADLQPDRYKPIFKPGQKLPPFEARDLAGQAVSLRDFAGKSVVLHFFSISNGQGLIELMDLQKRLGPELVAMGVCMDGRRERVEAWAKENKITLPILFDERGSNNPVATLYGVRSWATTLLIDPRGVLQSVDLSPFDPKLEAQIRAFAPPR